jgi:outer membrane protein OmpA-like peptidoglycan-associated protein
MKWMTTTLCAATVALSATAAMAQDSMIPATGGYATLMGGWTAHEIDDAVLNGARARIKLKDGWAISGAAGYKWESGFRTELELSHRHNKAKDLNSIATPLTGTQRDTSIMANLIYDIPTGSSVTPYFGIGAGAAIVDWNKISAGTGPVFDSTSTKFAWQAIAGVAFAIAPRWELLADVRYKGSSNHHYKASIVASDVTGYDNRSTTAMVGIRYSWGAPPEKVVEAAPPPPPPPAPVARPAPPPVPQKFLVFFDFDKSGLRADAAKIVAEGAEYAKHNNKTVLTVTGHADTSGSDTYNMGLSERRAETVKKELVRLGIPESEITVRWKGESEPLVQTGDGVKEPQNRRVEIVLE